MDFLLILVIINYYHFYSEIKYGKMFVKPLEWAILLAKRQSMEENF